MLVHGVFNGQVQAEGLGANRLLQALLLPLNVSRLATKPRVAF
jgi:hypothetical protein